MSLQLSHKTMLDGAAVEMVASLGSVALATAKFASTAAAIHLANDESGVCEADIRETIREYLGERGPAYNSRLAGLIFKGACARCSVLYDGSMTVQDNADMIMDAMLRAVDRAGGNRGNVDHVLKAWRPAKAKAEKKEPEKAPAAAEGESTGEAVVAPIEMLAQARNLVDQLSLNDLVALASYVNDVIASHQVTEVREAA